VTVEENALQGGFGSAILELLEETRVTDVQVKRIGIPDRFIEQGSQARLRKDLGMDAAGIAATAEAFLRRNDKPVLTRVK
jgi:1-deoxy-D-xylulose-5-phosphate synthase